MSGSTPRVLEALGGDARHEAMLVDTKAGHLVLKAVSPTVEATLFMDRTKRAAALAHPSLRPIRGGGRLPDGRLYVLVDQVNAPPLAKSSKLSLESVVQTGLELSKALELIHQAGLATGALLPSDIFLSHPAVLDVSLAPLTADASPASDVQALAACLIERAVTEAPLRRALEGLTDAASLTAALESIHIKAQTSVSGELAAPTVEVLEPDLSNNELGSWKLEKVLGEGAMGRVYLARHTRIGRLAAVKVLKNEHSTNLELVQRFIQEAQAVNAIKNEHIVEVYDFGEVHKRDGGRLVYCVMELLEGEALSDTLSRGPVSVKRAANIGMQLGRALHAAHQVGVIHRDIKPENIFLQRKEGHYDYVKVLDFGVAKLLKPIGDLPQSGTLAGVVVGTPEYMAPEQALGVSVDLRSDLYAVGLVLYELLSGTQPFQADTFGKLVVAITQTPPPPLPAVSRLNEALPRGLTGVVLKCLNKEPEARYESGEKLALALEPWAKGVPAPIAVDEEPLNLPSPSRLPKLLAALAAVVVVGVGAFFAFRPESVAAPVTEAVVEPAAAIAPVPEPVVAAPEAQKPEETITLEVTSAPAGARVARADTGELLGVTPLSKVVPKAHTTGLLLTLEGYEPEARDVNLSQSISVGIDLRPKKAAPDTKKKPAAKKKANVNNDGTVDPFEE